MRLVYATMFPIEKISVGEMEPFLEGVCPARGAVSDAEYVEKAICFANAKRVNMHIFEDEKHIDLEFVFHAFYVAEQDRLAFEELFAESNAYCIKVETGNPSELRMGLLRRKKTKNAQ